MPGIDELFDQVVRASQARAAQATGDVTAVNDVSGEIVRVLQQQADATKSVGDAEAAAIEAKGTRELEAGAERKRLEAAMLHPMGADDLVDFMGKSAARIAAQKEALDQERAVIVNMMQTKFLDDPLAYLSNAFTLPGEIQTYNAKHAGLQGEIAFTATVDNALKGALGTQKSLEATTSAVEVQKAAIKARNMADVVALESQYKALQSSITAVTLRNSLLNTNADSARDILNAKLAVLANARADEEMRDRREHRAKEKLEEQELNRVLPATFAAFGLDAKQGTVENWKKMTITDKPAADALLKFAFKLDRAMNASDPEAVARLTLADDPAEAYSLYKRGLPMQGNGEQGRWLDKIAQKTTAILERSSYEGNKKFNQLPAKEKEAIFRNEYNKVAAQEAQPNQENMSVSVRELASMKIGGESLSAKAPNLAKLFASNPALKESSFTPEELVRFVRNAAYVQGGMLDINKRAANIQLYAKELSYVYTAKMQSQFINVQPHLFNVAVDPKAKYSYALKQGSVGPIFQNTWKLDPTRADSWVNVLLKENADGQ